MARRKANSGSKIRLFVWFVAMLSFVICIGSILTMQGCKGKKNIPHSVANESDDFSYRQESPKTDLTFDDVSSPKDGKTLPMMAIIIDDLGYTAPSLVARLCNQSIAFDVAVLPYQAFTKQSAELAHSRGKEVMLHLPMEPDGYPGVGKDPGPYAVMHDLPECEVRHRVQKAIATVPFVKGVNNHMGSRITRDRLRMNWVLEEVKAKQFFFVDSRTEKNSVAFNTAVGLAIPSAVREVFLDDDRGSRAIAEQWRRAITIARNKGRVVAIGHICPETIKMLEKLIPEASDKVQFVAVSRIIK